MKRAYCEPLNNIREVVKFINANSISKDDIGTILNIEGQIFLLYFK